MNRPIANEMEKATNVTLLEEFQWVIEKMKDDSSEWLGTYYLQLEEEILHRMKK